MGSPPSNGPAPAMQPHCVELGPLGAPPPHPPPPALVPRFAVWVGVGFVPLVAGLGDGPVVVLVVEPGGTRQLLLGPHVVPDGQQNEPQFTG